MYFPDNKAPEPGAPQCPGILPSPLRHAPYQRVRAKATFDYMRVCAVSRAGGLNNGRARHAPGLR